MKRSIISIAAFFTLLTVITVNINIKKDSIASSLTLANMEALADGESYWDRTDFFAVLETIDIYNTNVSIAVGYKGFDLDIAEVEVGYLGYRTSCEPHWILTCDLTQVGFFPA